jgi:hypothetical protein
MPRSSWAVAIRLAAALACSTALPACAKDLQVGVCKRDITPVSPLLAPSYRARFGEAAAVNHSDPIWMAGFDNGRSAVDYHDRLWARGIVIEADGGRVALLALDVVGYGAAEVTRIRALVSPSSHIDHAVISSTHNHQGPDTIGLGGPTPLESGIDYAYLDFVNSQAAACLDEAARSLQEARVKFVTGTSAGLSLGLDPEDDGLGVGDGKVLPGDEQVAPDTGGRIVDPRLQIAQFLTRDVRHSTIATLVVFASHPESMGSVNRVITADFPHFARERLEAEYGGLAIWAAGDLGVLQGPLHLDVRDPDTGDVVPRRTFRWSEVHGTQLAERVIAALAMERNAHPAPKLSFATDDAVFIPLTNPFFRFFFATGVLDTRRAPYTDGAVDGRVGFPFPPPFDAIPQALGADVKTEVSAWRLGEGSFAFVPTELDPQIGEAYREHMSGAAHTFVVGLASDQIGYQVPFAKWNDSCHTCAPYVLAGVPSLCPVQPIDCSTVFSNNVGVGVDPAVTNALTPLLDALH